MVGANSSEDDAAEAMDASEPPVQLMDLPYDLLFSMLTHSSLGPREICRLEQVSWLVVPGSPQQVLLCV